MADPTNKVYYCPIELSLDLLSSRWKPKLLRQLQGGGQRVGELQRRLPLVTSRALSRLLGELERDGLAERSRSSDDPLRAEYSLTETGERFVPLLGQLAAFGSEYAAGTTIEILSDEPDESPEAFIRKPPEAPRRWLAWSWLPRPEGASM